MQNEIQLNVVQGPQPASTGTALKDVLGASAGFGAMSYALGFIIVNSFLRQYGAVPLTLISTKYLAAGLGFAFFYVIVALFFAVVGHVSFAEEWVRMIERRERSLAQDLAKQGARSEDYESSYVRWYKRMYPVGYFGRYLQRILFLHLRYSVLFALIVAPVLYLSGSSLRILYRGVHIYVWIYVVTLGFGLAKDFANQRKEFKWTLLPLVLVLFLISAMWYGQYIYGDISYSIGGGVPQRVEFVPKESGKEAIIACLGGVNSQQSSSTYDLIMETSDSFMILLRVDNEEQLVSVKKELVDGVIYKRKR